MIMIISYDFFSTIYGIFLFDLLWRAWLDVCVHQLYCGIEYIVHTLTEHSSNCWNLIHSKYIYCIIRPDIGTVSHLILAQPCCKHCVICKQSYNGIFFPFRIPCIYFLRNIKNYEKYSPSLDGCCFAPVAWHEQKKERLREREWATSTEHSTFTNGWNKKSSRLNSTMNYNSVA